MKELIELIAQFRLLVTETLTVIRGFMSADSWFYLAIWSVIFTAILVLVNTAFYWTH